MFQEILIEWAKAYYDVGWCVFPAKNKFPILPEYRQFHKGRPSRSHTLEYFEKNTGYDQIALLTGKVSGVTVIDIDVHRAKCPAKKGGVCVCNPLPPEQVLREECPFTLTSKTGSGGYHVFCTLANVQNSVGMVHPQLDIRSTGGVIILPPSTHESGNNYAWIEETPFNVNNVQNLAKFDTAMEGKLQERKVINWADLVKGVGIGNRNDSAASLVGKLLFAFEEDEWRAAWEILIMWNDRCDPPQSRSDLKKTFTSIAKSEIARRYGKS